MGQAKQRGTFEERIAQQKAELAAELREEGVAPHYLFVLDRSAEGQAGLRQLKAGPEEIQARVTSAPMQFWESLPNFEYVIIWGSWGYSGGLTMPCANLEAVLNEGLPATFARILEKGGLATYVVMTGAAVQEQIMARLAELQPTASNNAS